MQFPAPFLRIFRFFAGTEKRRCYILFIVFAAMQPTANIEIAVFPRRYVAHGKRRLDRQRAAAAERVGKRFFKIAVIKRTVDNARRQRFFQRRVVGKETVSAFMQSLARGIQSNRGDVFDKGYSYNRTLSRFGERFRPRVRSCGMICAVFN